MNFCTLIDEILHECCISTTSRTQ